MASSSTNPFSGVGMYYTPAPVAHYPLQSYLSVAPASPAPSSSSTSSTSRHRINVACTYCRTRKIKCSGQSPCANCVRTKRCCEFKEVPDEVNRRTKARKAQFKALKAAGFPTKSKAAKLVITGSDTLPIPPRSYPAAIQGWSPQQNHSPMTMYSTPPRPTTQSHVFPSVLTPAPAFVPQLLDGFSSVNPCATYPPSPPSSDGSPSPTPCSSPLHTPVTRHSAAYNAPRVSISSAHYSPSFEFDGSESPEEEDQQQQHFQSFPAFPAAPPPCDMRTHSAFPTADKRPSIQMGYQYEQALPSGNPGLGFLLPNDFAPGMPVDEQFVAHKNGQQSYRVATEDTWTTPFATISLTDNESISTWSLV